MKKTSFSFRSENADFPAWPVPSETPAGFPFKEGWIDVEMAPFVSYAGFLILGAEVPHSRPRGGSLQGVVCSGILPVAISNSNAAESFAFPGYSGPVLWRTPGNSVPWRLSAFQIRGHSHGFQGSSG